MGNTKRGYKVLRRDGECLFSCSLPSQIAVGYPVGEWAHPRLGWGKLTVFRGRASVDDFWMDVEGWMKGWEIWTCSYVESFEKNRRYYAFIPEEEWLVNMRTTDRMDFFDGAFVLVDPPWGTAYADAVMIQQREP